MKRIRESDFYIDRPQMLGWRGLSLLVPSIFAALGFCAFAILAFSFTEMAILPQAFRTGLVVGGAISLAVGGELGTLSSSVEIFRKNGQATAWDWTALVISVLATLCSFLLAFAALLGVSSTWADWLQVYGPIVLGLVAALDAYGGFVEFGLYLSTYDVRMQEWRLSFETFKEDEYNFAREQQRVLTTEKSNTSREQPASVQESTLEQARSAKAVKDAADRQERFAFLLDAFRKDPKASVTQLAKLLGTSRTTVYNDLQTLQDRGFIRKDGSGIVVSSGA